MATNRPERDEIVLHERFCEECCYSWWEEACDEGLFKVCPSCDRAQRSAEYVLWEAQA